MCATNLQWHAYLEYRAKDNQKRATTQLGSTLSKVTWYQFQSTSSALTCTIKLIYSGISSTQLPYFFSGSNTRSSSFALKGADCQVVAQTGKQLNIMLCQKDKCQTNLSSTAVYNIELPSPTTEQPLCNVKQVVKCSM